MLRFTANKVLLARHIKNSKVSHIFSNNNLKNVNRRLNPCAVRNFNNVHVRTIAHLAGVRHLNYHNTEARLQISPYSTTSQSQAAADEAYQFEAETKQLLDIVINSLLFEHQAPVDQRDSENPLSPSLVSPLLSRSSPGSRLCDKIFHPQLSRLRRKTKNVRWPSTAATRPSSFTPMPRWQFPISPSFTLCTPVEASQSWMPPPSTMKPTPRE